MRNTRLFSRLLLGLASMLVVILSCASSFAQTDWSKNVLDLIEKSKFAEATAELDKLTDLSPEEQLQKDWYIELMRRIRIEFRYDEAEIKRQLADDGYDNSDEAMRRWEEARSLEMRLIDGKRCYFKTRSTIFGDLTPSFAPNTSRARWTRKVARRGSRTAPKSPLNRIR